MVKFVISQGGMPSLPIATYDNIDPWYAGKSGNRNPGD